MRASSPEDVQRPLFVVGLVRSGTTLLYALLNKHPKIALMYECDALAVHGFAPVATRWPYWAERVEFWNRAFARHRIDSAEFEGSRDLRSLYLILAKRKDAAIYGEKSPAYSRCLERVAQRFPDARFIIVLRELPEVYRSIRDAARRGSYFLARPGQIPRLIWSHRALMHGAKRLRAKSFPVLFLRYREFAGDPTDAMRRVCEFSEVEFYESITSPQGADLSAVWKAPHHSHVRTGAIGRRSDFAEDIPDKLSRRLRAFSQASGQAPYISSEEQPPLTLGQRFHYVICLMSGWFLCSLDDGKRLLYEFLPISWLQWYRNKRGRVFEIDGEEARGEIE